MSRDHRLSFRQLRPSGGHLGGAVQWRLPGFRATRYLRRRLLAEDAARHGRHPRGLHQPAHRPHHPGPTPLPTRTHTDLLAGSGDDPAVTVGDWVLSKGIRDAAGTLVMPGARGETQIGPGPSDARCTSDALATCPTPYGPGAYNWELYQPASRFWLFQSIETGIYVALGAFLLYLAIRRIA
jgi:hypothetical protein